MLTILSRSGAYSKWVWGFHHGWLWARVSWDLKTFLVERLRDGEIIWSFTHPDLKLLYPDIACAPDGKWLAVAQTSIEPGTHPRNDKLIRITSAGFEETGEPCIGAEGCAVHWNGGTFVVFSRTSTTHYLRLPDSGPRKELEVPGPDPARGSPGAIGGQGLLDAHAGTADDGSADRLSWFDIDLRQPDLPLLLRAVRRGPVAFGQESSKVDRLSGMNGATPFSVQEGLGLLTDLAEAPNGEYAATWANPTNHPENATVSGCLLPPFPVWTPAVEVVPQMPPLPPDNLEDLPEIAPFDRVLVIGTEAVEESAPGKKDGALRPGNVAWSTYGKDETRGVYEGAGYDGSTKWLDRVPAGQLFLLDFDVNRASDPARGDEGKAYFDTTVKRALREKAIVVVFSDSPHFDDRSWTARFVAEGCTAVRGVQWYLDEDEGYDLVAATTRLDAEIERLKDRPCLLVPRLDDQVGAATRGSVERMLFHAAGKMRQCAWVVGMLPFGANQVGEGVANGAPWRSTAYWPRIAAIYTRIFAAVPSGRSPIAWPGTTPRWLGPGPEVPTENQPTDSSPQPSTVPPVTTTQTGKSGRDSDSDAAKNTAIGAAVGGAILFAQSEAGKKTGRGLKKFFGWLKFW